MYCGFVSGWKYLADEKSDENVGTFGLGVPDDKAEVAVVVVLVR